MTVATGAVRYLVPPGPPLDPYALAGDRGTLFDTGTRVLVGLGEAVTLGLPGGLDDAPGLAGVRRALASVTVEDRTGLAGAPVVAFGALPFERSAPTSMVVPALTYGREEDGTEWVTAFGDAAGTGTGDLRADLRARQHPAPSGAARRPDGQASIEPSWPAARFLDMVAAALDAIADGTLAKVVLARQVELHLTAAPDLAELLGRWRRLEPNCTVFSMPTPEGRFIGASPELLVARRGSAVSARPLAGTAGRGSEADDRLLGSTKDTAEHRLVVEAIAAALEPRCSTLEVPTRPELVHLRNVVHFGTGIQGTLRPDADGYLPTALDLVAALHPTPAVGGVPLDRALAAIARLEPFARGAYAGPVGYVDADGDGEWVVGIRAATLTGDTARLTAGVGIVSGSDPGAELAETDLKLAAVIEALVPGAGLAARPARSIA